MVGVSQLHTNDSKQHPSCLSVVEKQMSSRVHFLWQGVRFLHLLLHLSDPQAFAPAKLNYHRAIKSNRTKSLWIPPAMMIKLHVWLPLSVI